MNKKTINFFPMNQVCEIKKERTILEVAKNNSIYIENSCGGKAACGKCKIKIIKGKQTELTEKELECLTEEEIKEQYRLACAMRVDLEEKEEWIVLIGKKEIEQTERKKKIMFPQKFSPDKYEDKVQANVDKFLENSYKCGNFGIALDIGTTTIVAILWNLENGNMENIITRENPQRIIGADILSRMQYANEDEVHLKELKKMTIQSCNDMIQEVFIKIYNLKTEIKKNIKIEQFIEETLKKVVVVGNTAMLHLFLGYSTVTLSKYPFLSLIDQSIFLHSEEVGLIGSKDTIVEIIGIISGQIGSDITAAILATELLENDEMQTELLIDIGTNGEIVLKADGKILACSTAAGPAFEGGSIYNGMRAENGAIQGIELESGDIKLNVIGNEIAKGICGSGLISIISNLLEWGLIDETGKLIDSDEARVKGISFGLYRRIVYEEDGSNSFILKFGNSINKIILKQSDIREFQVAKSAIRSGIETLLNEANISIEKLNSIKIAGTFGNYLDLEKAIKIGLFPNVSIEKLILVGNAAGTGASMILLSKEAETKANFVFEKIKRIELSESKHFSECYFKYMNFELSKL